MANLTNFLGDVGIGTLYAGVTYCAYLVLNDLRIQGVNYAEKNKLYDNNVDKIDMDKEIK
jgi:hypothetical protein